MEYTDGLMEQYITESTNRVRVMGKDISGGQMALNIGESTRIACNGERESHKRTEYFTETSTKKMSSSVEVKYNEVLQTRVEISNKFKY
jgi:hypothetical protein